MPRPRSRLRTIYFSSLKKEAAFRAAVQAITGYTALRVMKTEFINPGHEVKDDRDLIGKTLEPNEQEIITKTYPFSISQNSARPNMIATIFAYLLGSDTMITPDEATDTRQHQIRFAESEDPPSGVMWEDSQTDSGRVQVQYKGVVVQSARLMAEIGGDRAARVSAEILAAERVRKASGANVLPKYPGGAGNDTYIANSPAETMPRGGDDAVFFSAETGLDSYGTGALSPIRAGDFSSDLNGGSVVDMTSRIHSIEWDFDNAIQPNGLYRLGGGELMSIVERGDVSQGLNVNFDYEDESALEAFEAQTPYAIQWISRGKQIEAGVGAGNTVTAAFYYGHNCVWPRIQYNGYTRTEVNGNLVCQASFTVLPEDIGQSVLVDVQNTVNAAYAAA